MKVPLLHRRALLWQLLSMVCLARPAAILAAEALAGGVVEVHLPHPAGGGKLRISGYAFDDRQHSFRVVDEGGLNPQRFGGIDPAMRSVQAAAGINGGFFAPDGAPLGRMVVDAQTTGRLAKGALTSGVIVRDGRSLQLLRVAEFEQKLDLVPVQLLQAGPFLVDAGSVVSGLQSTRSSVRSFVLHDQKHGWLIATTGPVTLADLAKAIAGAGSIGGVQAARALNLDGGSSSGLWAGGRTLRRPWKAVRNYLAVVPKP